MLRRTQDQRCYRRATMRLMHITALSCSKCLIFVRKESGLPAILRRKCGACRKGEILGRSDISAGAASGWPEAGLRLAETLCEGPKIQNAHRGRRSGGRHWMWL